MPIESDRIENPAPSPRRALLHVDRHWLFAIAGVVWTSVGILLLAYAAGWLAVVRPPLAFMLAAAGAVVAALFVRFVFSGIVRKNIARIEQGPARASAFAFQGGRSYLIAASMIALGIVLRHSSLPKPGLAIVYEGVGAALLLTSLAYHRRLVGALRSARR